MACKLNTDISYYIESSGYLKNVYNDLPNSGNKRLKGICL